MQERAVVETEAPCVEDIRRIWNRLIELLCQAFAAHSRNDPIRKGAA
jgi:hypothetical protein